MTAITDRPAGGAGTLARDEAASRQRPSAHSTADGTGGLSFDITAAEGAGRWDAVLLLRRRHTDPAETVRLPLVPGGAETLHAVLPGAMPLAEGRWDAFLVLGDGAPRRLLPGRNDLRSVVDRLPTGEDAWLRVRIPYSTKYGNLSVRAWLRRQHAEAGEIWLNGAGMALDGRLYGAELGPGATVEVRPHRSDAPVITVPADREGQRFTARLDFSDPDLRGKVGTTWGLWLLPDEGAGPVRIARILDDMHDKYRILQFPAAPLGGETAEALRVRPYYTGANDLSLRLESTP